MNNIWTRLIIILSFFVSWLGIATTEGSTISFSRTQYNVNENNGSVAITVNLDRSGDPDPGATVTVEYKTIPGTATENSDYVAQDSSTSNVTPPNEAPLTFTPGETSKVLYVPIVSDNAVENSEIFYLVLFNSNAHDPVSHPAILTNTATITVLDDDATSGIIGFQKAAYSINENSQFNPGHASSIALVVTRTGDITRQVAVNYATSAVTATEDIDYQGAAGTLLFGSGQTSKTISIPVFNDNLSEGGETFRVDLSPSFGGTSTATVTIQDDDAAEVNFSAAAYSVAENAGSATMTLLRTGNTISAVTVNVVTIAGTAAADEDYTTISRPVAFEANQTAATFDVPIRDDALIEGSEFFQITLSARINSGVVIGPTSNAQVAITDNERANTIEFSAPEFSVEENDSSKLAKITVRLNRGGNPNQTVSVQYFTSAGSATPNIDYKPITSASQKTLVFTPGQTLKTFTVPIIDDAVAEGTETVGLVLANPINTDLGATANATLQILDDENGSQPGNATTNLVNVSTRGPVGFGDEVMIAGLIIQGQLPKQIVLRGIGPSLTRRGVANAINDPTLALFDAQGTQRAANDNYGSNSQDDLQTLQDDGLTPTNTRESAIVATVTQGSYTAVLRGKTNGVGLAEVYDVSADNGELVNISTRAKVEQGDNGAVIAGFIIAPPPDQVGTPKRIVIRAIGPSLGNFGIANAVKDPTIELYRGSQKIVSNDNWKTTQETEISATGLAPASVKEAAIVTTLDPGSYTAVVRGKNNSTGIVLVEVYRLSP
jgi:Calx-beta domain-containing protein